MKCNKDGCTNEGIWRPVARFFAPAPYAEKSFTCEIGITLCAACKAATTVEELIHEEFREIVSATMARSQHMEPDYARTVLEWMPASESDLPPARGVKGGPVGRHIFICEDPADIAGARQSYGYELEVMAPGGVLLEDLAGKWSSPDNPPEYRCCACGGKFKHPIVGGGDVGVVAFRIRNERVEALLLHSRCWAVRVK